MWIPGRARSGGAIARVGRDLEKAIAKGGGGGGGGERRGRKRKEREEGGKKRALNGYTLFVKEQYADYATRMDRQEIIKSLGGAWKALPEEERKVRTVARGTRVAPHRR